jgi:hypothetical protein
MHLPRTWRILKPAIGAPDPIAKSQNTENIDGWFWFRAAKIIFGPDVRRSHRPS